MQGKLRGSLTVYLSLSLSSFILLISVFSTLCIINSEKERFEIACSLAGNSSLSEYCIPLYQKYDLLYIDTSYIDKPANDENLKKRLEYYLKENTENVYASSNSPWGRMRIKDIEVSNVETACSLNGLNMWNQICIYVDDSEHMAPYLEEARESESNLLSAALLSEVNPLERFRAFKEAVDALPLPQKKNIKGELEDVPVSNPADWVYGLGGSDISAVSGISTQLSGMVMDTGNLISHRGMEVPSYSEDYHTDKDKLMAYLIDKFGCYKSEKESSSLLYQLEYIAEGNSEDAKNIRQVAENIFMWRLEDNLSLAFSDGTLVAEAHSAAMMLEVCTLSPIFIEPVADSIIAACAYLETLSDMSVIFKGGRIPLHKSSHNMSVSNVLNGVTYESSSEEGLSYRQYVELMIFLMDSETVLKRTMDLMECEVRNSFGNDNFKMDHLIESFEMKIKAEGTGVSEYEIRRRYGYF